jgi:hypothetical protein
MEVCYQLHASVALTPGKEPPPPPVPTGQVADWVPLSVWTLWRREKYCTAGNPRWIVWHIARRYIDGAIEA